MRDLGTLGGRDSVAHGINRNSVVVGNSFIGAGDPRYENERAFLWSENSGMVNLGKSFEGWSRAIGINNSDVVLGWRQLGAVVCGFVWSEKHGANDIRGLSGRGFYPCAINDDGLVVGEGDDNSGNRRAFIWTHDGGLKQVAAPDDFHPADVDIHGNILGNIHSRPWQQPGIYDTVREKYFALPWMYNHQTSVKAMNQNGVILGVAHTDSWKHHHPLIWRLPRP
jgi:probable HAF family extracellular repeat protein